MFQSHVFPLFAQAIGRGETRRQLHALNDRQLEDIGLTRGQIDEVARGLSQQPRRAGPARRGLLARGLSLLPLVRAYRST